MKVSLARVISTLWDSEAVALYRSNPSRITLHFPERYDLTGDDENMFLKLVSSHVYGDEHPTGATIFFEEGSNREVEYTDKGGFALTDENGEVMDVVPLGAIDVVTDEDEEVSA